jgi:hypothetical protein
MNNIIASHTIMGLIEQKAFRIVCIILTIGFVLAIGYITTGITPDQIESFDTQYQIVSIPKNGAIPGGYYQVDASHMTQLPAGNSATPLPLGGIQAIPYGYYQTNVNGINMMAQVPYGYNATPDKSGIVAVTHAAIADTAAMTQTQAKTGSPYAGSGANIKAPDVISQNSANAPIPTSKPAVSDASMNVLSHYDSNNYNIQYHDDPTTAKNQGSIYNTAFGSMMVKDTSGNMVSLPYVPGQALPNYYQPGSFVFGATNFVPNYEDSVYLSRTTGLSTVAKAYPMSSFMGGFCTNYRVDKVKLEQKCNTLDAETCASTSCCVLFGGSKCVSGDQSGPIMKANYTDPSVLNKDVYYYQGKCYGNCTGNLFDGV